MSAVIFIRGISSNWSLEVPNDSINGFGIDKLISGIVETEKISSQNFFLTGDVECLKLNKMLSNGIYNIGVNFRLLGGKGGYGALLRSSGKRKRGPVNRDSSRDLDGRRVRETNTLKAINTALELKETRKKELEEEKKKKEIEKKAIKEKQDILKAKKQNILQKIQLEARTNAQNAVFSSCDKVEEQKGGQLKKLYSDSYFEDDSDSDSGSQTEDISYSISESQTDDSSDSISGSQSGDNSALVGPHRGEGDFDVHTSNHELSSENKELIENSENNNSNDSSSISINSLKNDKHSKFIENNKFGEDSDKFLKNKDRINSNDLDELDIVHEDKLNNQTSGRENSSKRVPEDQSSVCDDFVDLDIYESPQQLEELGLEKLKKALISRGMLCGGNLSERAERLFKVKGKRLEDIDIKLLSKNAKRTKFEINNL